MFLRRKPPQLGVLEELQQTYTDVCNITLKNLNFEETGHLEDALKGWKSLHTLLLYKIDLFEKRPGKITMEGAAILGDLRAIRDENVKHLVRIQMRIDEQNRRSRKTEPVLATSNSHSMSVPSLRNSTPASRSLTANGNRPMMKSLRPAYQMSAQNRDTIKAAANISWQKPKQKAKEEDELFDDFDQTEISNSNWERLNSTGSTSTSGGSMGSTSSNLIDLEEDQDELNFFEQNPTEKISKSMEDLAVRKKKPPPPPPKPRSLAPPKPPSTVASSPGASASSLTKPTIKYASKSTSDVRTTPASTPAEPKKYTYTQPTPINVKKMMANSSRPKVAQVKVQRATPQQKAPTAKPVVKKAPAPKAAAPVLKQVKKSNITYNVKPLAKPKGRPQTKTLPVEEAPNLPTMDDILTGYSHDDFVSADAGMDNPDESGMSPADQEALIKSIRGIDELSAVQILNDIVVRGDEVYWDDIVGLESAKNSLKEAVVYPFLRPDLFRGLREPTRGMLLFGPPGTGKTMLARAVATESKSTFFSISSSSLTSKYLGESEKLVKALFLMARKLSPSIVFIDEIDSLLGTRTEGEVESMRRIKNEFLVQWSELSSAAAGRDSSAGDVSRVLILGATNLPWGIDDAARRRFAKRVYIPLPEDQTRKLQISKLLAYQKHTLLDADFELLVELTQGFSGSDITLLAKDSAMGPLRSLGDKLLSTPTEEIRPIKLEDFVDSLKYIRPSVSAEGLGQYETWSGKFGSSGA